MMIMLSHLFMKYFFIYSFVITLCLSFISLSYSNYDDVVFDGSNYVTVVNDIEWPKHIESILSSSYRFLFSKDYLSKQYCLLFFYVPWSGLALDASMEFQAVAEEFHHSVTFMAIDCSVGSNPDCLSVFPSSSYPIVVMITSDVRFVYEGVLDYHGLATFVEFFLHPVAMLDSWQALQGFVLSSELTIIGVGNWDNRQSWLRNTVRSHGMNLKVGLVNTRIVIDSESSGIEWLVIPNNCLYNDNVCLLACTGVRHPCDVLEIDEQTDNENIDIWLHERKNSSQLVRYLSADISSIFKAGYKDNVLVVVLPPSIVDGNSNVTTWVEPIYSGCACDTVNDFMYGKSIVTFDDNVCLERTYDKTDRNIGVNAYDCRSARCYQVPGYVDNGALGLRNRVSRVLWEIAPILASEFRIVVTSGEYFNLVAAQFGLSVDERARSWMEVLRHGPYAVLLDQWISKPGSNYIIQPSRHFLLPPGGLWDVAKVLGFIRSFNRGELVPSLRFSGGSISSESSLIRKVNASELTKLLCRGRDVVVYFHMPTCAFCQAAEAAVAAAAKNAQDTWPDLLFLSMDITVNAIDPSYHVDKMPTLAYFEIVKSTVSCTDVTPYLLDSMYFSQPDINDFIDNIAIRRQA